MNKIIFIISIFVFLLTSFGCGKKQPDLISISKQTRSITIYGLEAITSEKYSEEDFNKSLRVQLDVKLFQALAPQATFKNKLPVWKGSSLAVLKMNDGTEKRLALSFYGAFFKILGERGYFVFEGEARIKWEKAIVLRHKSPNPSLEQTGL